MRSPTETFATKDEWLARRKLGIGGSDASVVMGCSPYSSRLKLWAEKLGLVEGQEESERMSWGHRLEPVVVEAYGEETGRTVVRHQNAIWQHPTKPMFASLDAVVARTKDLADDDRGPLEVKTTSPYVWKGVVPAHHLVQVQHYMACTGASWASYVVLVGSERLFWQDLERDDDFIGFLELECERFWSAVVAGEAPDPDGSAASNEAMRALYPKDEGTIVALPPEAQLLDEVILACDAQIEAHEVRRARAEAKLMKLLGTAAEGRLPDGVVWTWKTTKKGDRRLRRTVRA